MITFTPLAELGRINDVSLAAYGINGLFRVASLIEKLNAIKANGGTNHKYLRRKTPPTVGFRQIGAGLDRAFGETEPVTIELKYEDADSLVDVAEVRGFGRGSKEEYIAKAVAIQLAEALYKAEKQMIYGTTVTGGDKGDAAGYAGFAQATANLGGQVTSAGGTGNALTSVYGVRTGDEDVSLVVGNNGEFDVSDTTRVHLTEGVANSTKTFSAYLTSIGAYLGVQIGSTRSIGRIANIGANANKLTDTLLAANWATFPANAKPQYWAMNSASLAQLQASRTATSPTGNPAPMPTDSFGVPIIVTDAIVSTEAVVA